MKLIGSVCRRESTVNTDGIQHVSDFRRILPQIFGAMAKSLMIINIGQFLGFTALVIPTLTGLNKELNPDETVQITAEQLKMFYTKIKSNKSVSATFSHLAHPIGSLLSGPINDRIGRRKTIMLLNLPLTIGWICLGFSHSFPVICVLFTLLGFSFGLKEAPSVTYISEICEPKVRGTIITISSVAVSMGIFIAMTLGAVLSWRQVAFICALFPFACLIAVTFITESPSWLLSKGRVVDAQKSLQWLRGWVSAETVHKEFEELQHYAITSNACAICAKQSIECSHAKPTILDKIKEIKRQRNIRPMVLIVLLQFFGIFNGSNVWDAYIVQVLNTLGTPLNPSYATIIASGMGVAGSLFLGVTVKKLGRRPIYLTASAVLALCCFGLSVYAFTFFPLGWTSFKSGATNEAAYNSEQIRQMVGHFSYIALILVLVLKFCGKAATDVMAFMYVGEVYPFKMRSFLCGISLANNYILSSIAAKTYYNVEMLLSLPGAIVLYGLNSVIGFIVMYKILPETEGRSLADVELYYTDNTKRLTDIHITKHLSSTKSDAKANGS